MDFIKRHKAVILYILLSLVSIVTLSVHSSKAVVTCEGIGSALVMPFQKLYHGAQNGVHMLWAGLTELSDVREELQKTRQKLEKYEAINEDLFFIKQENKELRALLDFSQALGNEAIPARIISKDPDNWFKTILINKGSDSGIKMNMPVIAYDGENKAVAGKIIEVRRSVSRIQPINSPELKLGVYLQNSGYPGLMSGFSSSNDVSVDYISKSASVLKGDLVVTSGQGGIFPEGIQVGRVIAIYTNSSSAFQKIEVEPIVDYNKIKDVFVIKKEPNYEFLELLHQGEEE